MSKRRIVSVVPWLPSELSDLQDGGSRNAVCDGVGPPNENVAVTDGAVRQISSLQKYLFLCVIIRILVVNI